MGGNVAKGSKKETKLQNLFIERDKRSVEHEMYDHTRNKWRVRNIKGRLKENFGSHTRRTSVDLVQKTAIPGT